MKYFFWNKYPILTQFFHHFFIFRLTLNYYSFGYKIHTQTCFLKKTPNLSGEGMLRSFTLAHFTTYRIWQMILVFVGINIISLKLHHVEKCGK
jgi:hypothetical protein